MEDKQKSRLQACVGSAVDLNAMVDYSADAVVSKTILDSPEGTVTAFAFDKGQRLSEHTSPYDALVQVIDGVGSFKVADTDIPVEAGQLMIMPANVPHAVTAVEKFKMLLTLIRS